MVNKEGLDGGLAPAGRLYAPAGNASSSVCRSSMPLVQTGSRGFALPLTLSCSAVLLISSLSLQTIALHGRQRSRQALATAKTHDADQSVLMAFQQHAQGALVCLLALPSSAWPALEQCPAADPSPLQAGRIGDRHWQLLAWQPTAATGGTLQLSWSDGQQSRIDVELQP